MTKPRIVKNSKILYVAEPQAHINPAVHLQYVEENTDLDNVALKGEEMLLKTLYLSNDPYNALPHA
jgi:NADPH-dependent curcumin reductase CurA